MIGSRGKDRIRRLFNVWERATQQSRVAGRTSEEVATLKYEMCNLKATLHDVTGKSELAANLAAERALNRWQCIESLIIEIYYVFEGNCPR